MEENKKRNSFTGSIGFVLAAAGSAVGLGNLWRFPYLAARDGGGLFLLMYLFFALSFGFTLLIAEVAIGRKTKQSALTAYGKLHRAWNPLGIFAVSVPFLVLPYYCVIGGWVLKYFLVFLTGSGVSASENGYFTSFTSDTVPPIVLMVIFTAVTALIVLEGVEKGIEKFSEVIMPLLIILILAIAVYSLTLTYEDPSGEIRTGLQGFKILVLPDLKSITLKSFFVTMMDALGQLFYSLSIAMGIMISYGSYMRDETNLPKSVSQIEIFDTLVAFLAGMMIIPSVYVFMGNKGLESSGAGLMFESLPMVFAQMGKIGNIVGCMFFAMVLFAAATSSVSIMEAVVSSLMDAFSLDRKKAVALEALICTVLGLFICLGYNKLYFEVHLPNNETGNLLDVVDYISNAILMPIVSIGTCILVGWMVGPASLISEIVKNGEKFKRKKLFVFVIKYVAPILLVFLLLEALDLFKGIG